MGPVFVVRKLFYFPKNFLSLLWSVGYAFLSTIHVKGFNIYEEGRGTKGKVRSGQIPTAFFSGEYSINQRWVLAFDTKLLYLKKSHFSGKKIANSAEEKNSVTLPTSLQIRFAPEFGYNLVLKQGYLQKLGLP